MFYRLIAPIPLGLTLLLSNYFAQFNKHDGFRWCYLVNSASLRVISQVYVSFNTTTWFPISCLCFFGLFFKLMTKVDSCIISFLWKEKKKRRRRGGGKQLLPCVFKHPQLSFCGSSCSKWLIQSSGLQTWKLFELLVVQMKPQEVLLFENCRLCWATPRWWWWVKQKLFKLLCQCQRDLASEKQRKEGKGKPRNQGRKKKKKRR